MKYYLIAGEASGDLHGSNLMKGLKAKDPNAEFRFWGGDLMANIGGSLVRHYKDTAVMGGVEILSKLGKIAKNLQLCKEDIITYNPDVVILIDYPGFNMKIAKFAHEHSFKVFYYIAPKVWATRESRIKKIKTYVDKLFIIFPFEIDYFRKKQVEAIYCGNPLIDSIAQNPAMQEDRKDFLSRYNLQDKPIIALLAGSRKAEIDSLLPTYIELAKKYSPHYQFILAAAPSIQLSYYDKYTSDTNITIIQSDTYAIVKNSKAAIVASGTASLETAIIGTPQVVCYRVHPITAFIIRKIAKIKYVSLGNLILNKLAFKELLQEDFTLEKVSKELDLLTKDNKYIAAMHQEYDKIKSILGKEGASEKIAEAMINQLHNDNL